MEIAGVSYHSYGVRLVIQRLYQFLRWYRKGPMANLDRGSYSVYIIKRDFGYFRFKGNSKLISAILSIGFFRYYGPKNLEVQSWR